MSQAADDGGPVGAGLEDRGQAEPELPEQTQRPERVRGLRCADGGQVAGMGMARARHHGERSVA
jgi:hypothetical protein